VPVESEEQIFTTAHYLKARGKILRAEPLSLEPPPTPFQGLEEEGFKLLATAGKEQAFSYIRGSLY